VARVVALVDLDHEDVADPARVVILEQARRAVGVEAAVQRHRALAELAGVELAMLGVVRRDVTRAAGGGAERGGGDQRRADERPTVHDHSPTMSVAGATSVPWTRSLVAARRALAGSPGRAGVSSVAAPWMITAPRRISTETWLPRGSGGGRATMRRPIGA